MTPEEYMDQLRDVRLSLDSVKVDIERAIHHMERRLITGYENKERDSRLAVGAAREQIKCVVLPKLWETMTAEIEY